MDFYQELLLTGLISVLIAFLIGKIASIPVDDDEETDLASSAHIAAGSSANAVSVHPIAEKEIERNSPPGDACPSGVSFDDSDQAEALCFEVEPQRLDLEKEEFSKEVEVGASKVDESSTKKVGDFVKKEEISVRDEKVLDSCGENAVENEDASAMDEKDGLLLHGEDDWEGIECSDLEKLFGVAAEFVASEKGGNAVCKLSNEVQLQLYGLHKVATEGPCYGPKPMALMVSARSKWLMLSLDDAGFDYHGPVLQTSVGAVGRCAKPGDNQTCHAAHVASRVAVVASLSMSVISLADVAQESQDAHRSYLDVHGSSDNLLEHERPSRIYFPRHAWQRLGNMSPGAAMEEYISLLANSIPGWIVHQTMAQPKDNDCKDPGAVEISQVDHNDLRSPSHSNSGTERLVGDSYPVKDATDAVATDPKFLNDAVPCRPALTNKSGILKSLLANQTKTFMELDLLYIVCVSIADLAMFQFSLSM
ncbi:hypothetical protein ZIOFF_058158 [Zingiber officinale]|uniref:ACB domain-containing protein n=1 Tax=Zingiber officinale TaxID=94328 RepID=A0A8J5FE78_ZINOF|nr:hypothetical protein ZIOFF_058158 [Zingiber officinale]